MSSVPRKPRGASRADASLARARAEANAAAAGEPLESLDYSARFKHIEDRHQAALVSWANAQLGVYPQLALLYAVPNGGKRIKKINAAGKAYSPEAARMKAQGVRAGVPDLDLPVLSVEPGRIAFCQDRSQPALLVAARYLGLRIEMKRPIVPGERKPEVSPDQKWWLTALQAAGHCCCVCYGWDQARESILAYLTGAPVPNQWSPKP